MRQWHDNLLQDYQALDHNSGLMRQAITCILRDVLAREAALPGGQENPIEVGDDEAVAAAEAMPWEEVVEDEVEVV